jgi:hypothetical protein
MHAHARIQASNHLSGLVLPDPVRLLIPLIPSCSLLKPLILGVRKE